MATQIPTAPQYPTSPREAGPGRGPYLLAALIFVVGIASFVFFLLSRLNSLTDDLIQVVVPGEQDLALSEPGDYTIFHEYRSVIGDRIYSSGQTLSGLRVSLVFNETGEAIRLSPATSSSQYDLGGRSGAAVFEFQIDRPGSYRLSARYPQGVEGSEVVLTVGHGFMKKILLTVFPAIGIMFGTMALTAGIIVTTFLKRRKARG
jgi:uncharacterized membrane protein